MSGPKVDEATLRQMEMERLAAARRARKNLMNRIQRMIDQVSNCLGGELELLKNEADYDRIVKQQSECCRELKRIQETVRSGNELLNIEELSKEAQWAVDGFNDSTRSDVQILRQRLKTRAEFQQLETNRRQLEQAKKKKIVLLTTEKENTDAVVTEADVRELVESFSDEFESFMTGTTMTSKHKNAMLLIRQDLRELTESSIPAERKEKRIKRLFGDFRRMREHIQTEMDEMAALYAEYEKECFDLSAPLKNITSFDSKSAIEEEIAAAKKCAEARLSKEYIQRQINEVMAKHGYDIVRSDMLTKANQNGQVLYGVDQDTAIDVFVSDENQVTMRVVGIGFDSDISEAENERLFQKQCAFCSMHPQITAELAMRGVVLHTKKHMPPDRRFNKKIQTRTKNSSQSMSRAKKELKRTELKTMHKE